MGLEYNDGNHLFEGKVLRISASSMNTLITTPYKWFRETILDEEGFKGNTSSLLGTCIHYIAEKVAKNESIDRNEIDTYINKFTIDNPDLEINVTEILNQLSPMSSILINNYVNKYKNMYMFVEPFIYHQLNDYIIVGGSVDAVLSSNAITEAQKQALNECFTEKGTLTKATAKVQNIPLKIVDYKTYGSTTEPKIFPMNYKYQLLTYAYVMTKLGYTITDLELVYISKEVDKRTISEKTGKQIGKLYPSKITRLNYEVTNEDLEFIESIIEMVKDKIELTNNQPELSYLLWSDPRLKSKETVKQIKNYFDDLTGKNRG